MHSLERVQMTGLARLFGISIATALLVATAGCQRKVEPTHSGKIAVVVSTLNNPFFVVLAETAKNQAEVKGYAATIFDSQNDTAKEASHFENIVAGGYRAILFNPTDAEGSILSAKKANDAGIPVFCMDREINSTEVTTAQILSDNYSGCVTLGKHFVEILRGKGRYVEILGLVSDNNTWNRSQGFHSVVDKYPDLEMVAQQSGEFDRAKAMEVMDSILQSTPDIDAVFCGNDAMAMGVYQSLFSAGRTNGEVKIFGHDGTADAINAIAEGKIEATMMQFPRKMAAIAAEWADRYLKGERGFPPKMPVAVELITADNVDSYVSRDRKGD
jgi:ribose transport system substrate-binding protein